MHNTNNQFPKKVLLINEQFSDNVGDQAIADAMSSYIQSKGFQICRYDYSFREQTDKLNAIIKPKKPCYYIHSMVKSCIPRSFKTLRHIKRFRSKIKSVNLDDVDYVVIGGGQLVLSNIVFPAALSVWTSALRQRNIDIYILASGVGEKFTFLEKLLIKKALRKCRRIYLRDKRSIENARLNFKISALYCPDIAYYLTKKEKNREKEQRNFAALGITDFDIFTRYNREMNRPDISRQTYLNHWLGKAKKYNNQGLELKLISTTYKDHLLSQELSALLDQENIDHKIIDFPMTWENFMREMKEVEVIESGRMHALILAHASHVTSLIPSLISKKLEQYSLEYISKKPHDIKHQIETVRLFDH